MYRASFLRYERFCLMRILGDDMFRSAVSRAVVITLVACSGRVSRHISGKNERIQTKLDTNKLRQKGNPQENLGVSGDSAPFLCVYVSPASLTPQDGIDRRLQR